MDSVLDDPPMAMCMAAFIGISWYIGAEINLSLFLIFKRRRGLYFWSCALVSWGVILQSLFIVLADFEVWKNPKGAITMIYLTWFMMVVPQSWILYSRLHLIMYDSKVLKRIRAVLVVDSIVFSVPTIVIGILAQVSLPSLFNFNLVWDRLQFVVFFVQETALGILYIYQARKYLQSTSLLHEPSITTSSSLSRTADGLQRRNVLHRLIYINIFIIVLDIALLGINSADLFYLQGALKPCVYGIKLKAEFVILNSLIESARGHNSSDISDSNSNGTNSRGIWRKPTPTGHETWSSGEPNGHHVQLTNLGLGSGRHVGSRDSQHPILVTSESAGYAT
ncbi:integral membrane protein [Hypoxylon rubiginosum]|uniref:Integral membrane protein n=1 Tax=Hypoxylon rubiginosum TaxID=110542 RepID=A0ACB9YPL5_9PEZI|nr:integral membrane protein [Hypoxylon rubiginosum]